MSQDNVELVLRSMGHQLAGRLAEWVDTRDPDIGWDISEYLLPDWRNRRDFDAVEGFYASDAANRGTEIGSFEGAAAIRGLLEDFLSAYREFHAEAEEVSDIGNGVTFGVTIFKGRLVGGNGQLQLRVPSVIVWTHGLIQSQTDYMDIDEARAAAERLTEERG